MVGQRRVQAGKGLEARISRALEDLGGRGTISQIAAKLGTTYQNVRKAIERMVSRGLVIKDDWSNPPEILYHLAAIPLTRWLGEPKDLFRVEVEREEFEKGNRLILDIVRKELVDIDSRELKKYFREAARRLEAEDPRKLLLQFAKWLYEEHKACVDRLKNAKKAGDKKRVEEMGRKVWDIDNVADSVFARQLGVPRKGLQLKFKPRTLSDEAHFDPDIVDKHLKQVVLGRSFLERFKVGQLEEPYTEVGTDASLQIFSLGDILPKKFERHPMAILAAVAIYYNLYTSEIEDVDAKPSPSTWVTYTSEEAIDQGILVPPSAYLQLADPRLWERTLSAALNVRQYLKDHEALNGGGRRRPDVVFRDGRIFPLEHLFSDYTQPRIHGQMVRNSLRAFSELVKDVNFSDRVLYCGTVKRAGVEFIAPLVFWYLRFGSGMEGRSPIWPDMDPDLIFHFRLSDQGTVLRLFEGLSPDLSSGEIVCTCRFVRRFSYMMEPELRRQAEEEGVTKEDQWISFIEKRIEEKKELIEEPDPELYALLCARAAVLSFYCGVKGGRLTLEDLPTESTALPRYEILLPYRLLESSDLVEKEREYVGRVLTALADPRTLDIYTETLKTGARPILPWALCRAHEFVKDTVRLYREDFRGYLFRLAVRVAEEEMEKRRGLTAE